MLNLGLTPGNRLQRRRAGGFGWVMPGAVIDEDFANNRAWPRPFTDELVDGRASDQYVTTSGGVLVKKAAGVLSYGDTTLLIEPSRTNAVRNNAMQGVVGGSPGTAPTNWSVSSTFAGLSRQIVGAGIDALGFDYCDIRYSGAVTSTAVGVIAFEQTTQIAAANGQSWAASFYVQLIAGATTGMTSWNSRLGMRDGAGAALTVIDVAFTPSATPARISNVATLNNAATAFLSPQIVMVPVNGASVDFTLRIGWPQAAIGNSVSSPIRTMTAAATRAANSIQIQRAGIGRVVFTFDDNSTQTVSGIDTGVNYTLPTNLNRPLVKRLTGYAA